MLVYPVKIDYKLARERSYNSLSIENTKYGLI